MLPLPPESEFSRAVFKLIRPHIPRERWPVDTVRARFEPGGDGLWLDGYFDDLPHAYARLAAQLVREAGVDLVIQSPMAAGAAAVVRAKRWRDAAMYAFLPLMFAIPLMAPLSESAMHMAALLFGLDLLVLPAFQSALASKRKQLKDARFIAFIPAPGLKINLSGRGEGLPLNDLMPDV